MVMEPLIHWKPAALIAAAFFAAFLSIAGPSKADDAAPAVEKTADGDPSPTIELKVNGPTKAMIGHKASYEIVVTNAAKKVARGLTLVDYFDAGLEHAVKSTPIEYELPELAPGKSHKVSLTFNVQRVGSLSHTVEVMQQNETVLASKTTTLVAVEKAAKAKPNNGSADAGLMPTTPFNEPPKEKKTDLGPPLVENAASLRKLTPDSPVWIDRQKRCVVIVGAVCQRQVPLELFACLANSKEHESVLTVPVKASFVHAALLAVGAEAGEPVRFQPKYVPAHGSEIEITVAWKDREGARHTARAQDWVRNTKTKKAMEQNWVFGGSRFGKNPQTGEAVYQADRDGDFICVSNFSSAMLDLPIASTSVDADLMFEAFTERIPPRGTPVTVLLTPKPSKADVPKTVPSATPSKSAMPIESPAKNAVPAATPGKKDSSEKNDVQEKNDAPKKSF
jgi:hypothetical protein